MLIRIVKLTLKKENIASFEQIFEETKDFIRNFEGCLSLGTLPGQRTFKYLLYLQSLGKRRKPGCL